MTRKPLFVTMLPTVPSRSLSQFVPYIVLAILVLVYFYPAIAECVFCNSDVAVVGLQAEHILRGEWSWHLWATSYQGSFYPAVMAPLLALFGPNSMAMATVSVAGYIGMIWLTFSILKRRVGLQAAFVLTLIEVFVANFGWLFAFYPRFLCAFLIFAAFWLIDGASESRRPLINFAVGAFLATFAVYVDLFAAIFLPGLAVLALCASFDNQPSKTIAWRRIAASAVGAILGALILLASKPGVPGSTMNWADPVAAIHRLSLVRNDLAYLLGCFWTPTSPGPVGNFWCTGPLVALRTATAGMFLVALTYSGWLSFSKEVSWQVRRLGIAGILVTLTTIAGFLHNSLPDDTGASRFLWPIVLAAPLTLCPLAAKPSASKLRLLIAPYLVVAALSGWIMLGASPREFFAAYSVNKQLENERKVGIFLRAIGVKYGFAGYWTSYHLTFLYNENPTVVPILTTLDRYAPYLNAAAKQPSRALITSEYDHDAKPDVVESELEQAGIAHHTVKIDRYTIFLIGAVANPSSGQGQ